MFLTLKRAAK